MLPNGDCIPEVPRDHINNLQKTGPLQTPYFRSPGSGASCLHPEEALIPPGDSDEHG